MHYGIMEAEDVAHRSLHIDMAPAIISAGDNVIHCIEAWACASHKIRVRLGIEAKIDVATHVDSFLKPLNCFGGLLHASLFGDSIPSHHHMQTT